MIPIHDSRGTNPSGGNDIFRCIIDYLVCERVTDQGTSSSASATDYWPGTIRLSNAADIRVEVPYIPYLDHEQQQKNWNLEHQRYCNSLLKELKWQYRFRIRQAPIPKPNFPRKQFNCLRTFKNLRFR